MSHAEEIERLHQDLGFQKLSPTWAKLEIVLGLSASIGGLLCAVRAVATPTDVAWYPTVGSAVLHVLGTYLAMAGHRSHLYQSQTRLTAYILSRLVRGDVGEGM